MITRNQVMRLADSTGWRFEGESYNGKGWQLSYRTQKDRHKYVTFEIPEDISADRLQFIESKKCVKLGN